MGQENDEKAGIDVNEAKKTLIVYYSNTGHTLRIAEAVRKKVGGTLYGIYPWQPYPVEPWELERQIRREQQEGYCPRLLPLQMKPEDYDEIFLGTPNWYGRIAPPLATLLATGNFNGKILIPFCTYTQSGISQMKELIKACCPGAKVREGFSVKNDKESDVNRIVEKKLEKIWAEGETT